MLPLTAGFLIAGPAAGWLSDRYGARPFSVGGMLMAALSFGLLMMLPANFGFPLFALLLLLNGLGMGLFAAPNTTGIMNSVPAGERGAASGMRATFQNTGMVLSIGLFFSLMIVGLSGSLPTSMRSGLEQHGVPSATAEQIANEPPVGSLFAAFLGYNPMEKLVPHDTLAQLKPADREAITGKEFFPELISDPFIDGLRIAFTASLIMCLVAAWASWLRGGKYVAADDRAGPFGAPEHADADDEETPMPEEWVPA
jgi:MFS family permease